MDDAARIVLGGELRSAMISVGLLVAGGAVTFLATLYWTKRRERLAGEERTNQRIIDLEKQLATLGATVVPISTAFQALLVKELTHMHTPRMDELLAKIGPPTTLTEAEEEELAAGLAQRAEDMGDLIDESEREAAMLLPLVIKRAKREAEAAPASDVQLVGLPEDDPGDEEVETAEGALNDG